MTGVLFRFCATVVAMPTAAWLLPGVHAANSQVAWLTGVLLGLIYLILRPIAKLLLSPLNCLSLGVIGFLADVGFVYLAARWMGSFRIDGFLWAIATALLVALLREGLGKIVVSNT